MLLERKVEQGPPSAALGETGLDPLAELFLHYAKRPGSNANAMQIVVAGARLRLELVRRAIGEVAPQFPILLSKPLVSTGTIRRGHWRPEDVECEEVQIDAELRFDRPEFRRSLTRLSFAHPVDWETKPPVRFWLVQSVKDPGRSCLLMTASHATADAKSDSMLLEAILAAYGALHVGANSPRAPRHHGFRALDDMLQAPQDRKGLGLVKVLRDSQKEIFAGHLGLRKSSAVVRRTPGRQTDFYREILPDALQTRIDALARASGHTINTVFTAALVRAMLPDMQARPGAGQRLKMIVPVSIRNLGGPDVADDYRNFMLPSRLSFAVDGDARALLDEVAREVAVVKSARVHLEIEKLVLMCRFLRRSVTRALGLWVMDGFQKTSVAYSNPGVIQENFRFFGDSGVPVEEYIGFGCVMPPLDFILYTPKLHGKLELNAVYFPDAFDDFQADVIGRVKQAIFDLSKEIA